MRQCSKCGNQITSNAKLYEAQTVCISCWEKLGGAELYKKHEQVQIAHEQVKTPIVASFNSILLTTETAPNLNITKRIEIVTAECAFGMNIFKDLFAGVRNVVGGRSEAVQKTMRDSRRTALYELKKEAYEVGANAVVGVDLDYVELSNAGSMVMLVASGTAVLIEELGAERGQ